MAINNVNEFLRKTFSETIFGTPALRPIAVCADGFSLSIPASSMHYCRPSMREGRKLTMEVFTIVANEVIGLSATECTLIQFSYNPEQIRDPESVLRSAVKDYLKTDEGKRQLEINCGCWNWGDVDDIPGSFFLNYGLAKIAPPDVNVIVDRNESFTDDYDDCEEE